MPPDIRGFFGPKGRQSNTSNHDKSPAKVPVRTPVRESRKRKSVGLGDDDEEEDVVVPKGKRANSRKTRKVIEDDDDDDNEDDFVPAPKKSSAKKSRKISYVIRLITFESRIADSVPRKETTTTK